MSTIAQAARDVRIIQPENINSPQGITLLRELKPDLLAVAAYGQILSRELLAIPTRGTINVHASLLPKYRGAAPVAYAILKGESQTGVSIIKVTPGLDSGEIILQQSCDIHTDDTTGTLEYRLAQLGATLAVTAVSQYQSGLVTGAKQDPAQVTKAPKITKDFGQIDWSLPAHEIERFVRAMQPWPTAFSFLHRAEKEPMRVIVNRSRVMPLSAMSVPVAAFGTVLQADQIAALHPEAGRLSPLIVRSGGVFEHASWIMIDELQPAGKKKMTAAEFLRGYPVAAGMHFGPETRS